MQKKMKKIIKKRIPIIYYLYNKYFWQPSYPCPSIQHMLDLYSKNNVNIFVIQIGANDGKTWDPIYEFIMRYRWSGILVEPQKQVFEKLKETHKNNRNIICENLAIASKNKTKKMDKIAFTSARWATGLSSFSRSNLEKLIDVGYIDEWSKKEGIKTPNNHQDYITTEDVNCLTFSNLLEKHKKSSLKRYLFKENNNVVYYLSGDKFHEDLWRQLTNNKFTLIFSDACHKPESIESELEFLLKYDLIDDDEFIMLWDDINSPLVPVFRENIAKLNRIFKKSQTYSAIWELHGTYGGDKLGKHKVGVFIYKENLSPKVTKPIF